MDANKNIHLVIVTGLSGAGKTQAIHSLEDLGYFCVDNLPPTLIPKFAELFVQAGGKVNRVALVSDIRGGKFFDSMNESLDTLDEQEIPYTILFLEASDETLIRRFKESRRRHPLSGVGRVQDGIKLERQRMADLRGRAHKIIDTSDMKASQLKETIVELFRDKEGGDGLEITVMSFGYKYGVPRDVDLLMDVRFLPNPHYIPELRPKTGHEKEIQDFVLNSDVSKAFMEKFHDLVEFLIPHYIKEGKTHLVIGIGCTGGKHRSVTLALKLEEALKKKGYRALTKHRDIGKDGSP